MKYFRQGKRINKKFQKKYTELVSSYRLCTKIEQEDGLDTQILGIENELELEMLKILKESSPDFFEHFVHELLRSMGYGSQGSSYLTSQTRDGGIDVVIHQDKLGIDKILVQAKRFKENKVSVESVRNFAGVLSRDRIPKGVLVTTSSFTKDAQREAQNLITLIDGAKLARLAIDYNVGVKIEKHIAIKKLDLQFFEI